MDAVPDLEQLEARTRKEAEDLRPAWEAPPDEPENFLLLVSESCRFTDSLFAIWDVMMLRLRRGGAPARLLEKECDFLTSIGKAVAPHLGRIEQGVQARGLPREVAEPWRDEVRRRLGRLTAITLDAARMRQLAARSPGVKAGPEAIRRLAHEADANKQWLSLRDVVAKMQAGGAGTEE